MGVKSSSAEAVLANLHGLLPELETVYKDIHSHPDSRCRSCGRRVWPRGTCAPWVTKWPPALARPVSLVCCAMARDRQ